VNLVNEERDGRTRLVSCYLLHYDVALKATVQLVTRLLRLLGLLGLDCGPGLKPELLAHPRQLFGRVVALDKENGLQLAQAAAAGEKHPAVVSGGLIRPHPAHAPAVFDVNAPHP